MKVLSFFPLDTLQLTSGNGLVIVVCPKCDRTVREYRERVDTLNEWAFRGGACVEVNGADCDCFQR